MFAYRRNILKFVQEVIIFQNFIKILFLFVTAIYTFYKLLNCKPKTKYIQTTLLLFAVILSISIKQIKNARLCTTKSVAVPTSSCATYTNTAPTSSTRAWPTRWLASKSNGTALPIPLLPTQSAVWRSGKSFSLITMKMNRRQKNERSIPQTYAVRDGTDKRRYPHLYAGRR